MSNHAAAERAVHDDPLRAAAAAAFAAALLNVACPVKVDHNRDDLVHSARTLAAEAQIPAAGRTLLNRLLSVVSDESSSPDRIRRGVIATYRGLAGARS